MDSIVAAIGEMFGPVAGLILALAVVLGGATMWLQGGALKAPGPDRDRLLRSLEVGGDLRRLYVFWLTRVLNRVDRLLGDADKAAFSLPSPFGNREPAPYWTGWSFDVCALLAVVYPLLGVFAGWVWTGDAGAVGRGLGMSAAAPPTLRGTAALVLVAVAFALRQHVRSDGWRATLWFVAAVAVAIDPAVLILNWRCWFPYGSDGSNRHEIAIRRRSARAARAGHPATQGGLHLRRYCRADWVEPHRCVRHLQASH